MCCRRGVVLDDEGRLFHGGGVDEGEWERHDDSISSGEGRRPPTVGGKISVVVIANDSQLVAREDEEVIISVRRRVVLAGGED